jgi:hypothetical protein
MRLVILALLIVLAGTVRAQQLQHDVGIDSVSIVSITPIGLGTPLEFWIRNFGIDTERHFGLVCIIKDQNGTIVYRDSLLVATMAPGERRDERFADFTLLQQGSFHACANIILLPGDQDRANDTSCQIFKSAYERDAQMLAVQSPKINESIVFGTAFRPRATVRNLGVTDEYFVPVRFEIRRVTDGTLVFRADTTVEALDADSVITTALFQSATTSFDTRKIPPGQYRAAAIARLRGDGDPSNDTAYTTFGIYKDHDLSTDAILSMPSNSILGIPIPLRARFTNHGMQEYNAPVRYTVSWQGQLRYCDTVVIPSFANSDTIDIDFPAFTAQDTGLYTFCAEAIMVADSDASNNSRCATFYEKIQHDLRAVSLVDLPRRITVGERSSVTLRIECRGWRDEKNAAAVLLLQDHNGNVVHQYELTNIACASGSMVDVVFDSVMPMQVGEYSFLASVILSQDQIPTNNLAVGTVIAAVNNVEALRVEFPKDGDSLPPDQAFFPAASFRNTGPSAMRDVGAHLEIRDSSGALLAELGQTIDALPRDSVFVIVSFPSTQGAFSTNTLPAGTYYIAAYAERSNPADTVYSHFTIDAHAVKPQSVVANADALTATLSPNPSSGLSYLSMHGVATTTVSVRVFDLFGNCVVSQESIASPANEQTIALHLESLPSGHYEAFVRSGYRTFSIPIAILH